MTSQTTITIQGRDFTATAGMVPATGRRWYLLSGPRGAKYVTVPAYIGDEHTLKAVDLRGHELRIRGNAVRLTDAGGVLREVVQ